MDVRGPCQEALHSKDDPDAATASKPVSKCPAIVPRVVWEAGSLPNDEMQRAIGLIVDVIGKHTLDGIVLEVSVTKQWFPWIRKLYAALKHSSHKGFHGRDLHLVLVLPPTVMDAKRHIVRGLSPEDVASIAPFVDRFSLMTYDYSSSRGRIGPNAPIEWMRAMVRLLTSSAASDSGSMNVEVHADGTTEAGREEAKHRLAKKILLGLNMYGSDNGQPITGPQYVSLLQQYRPKIVLDEPSGEHKFQYKDAATGQLHSVWFPTLHSIKLRHNLA